MRRNGEIRGFALPTVLIASVVMLIVLSVSVTSVVAVRTALKTQYYEQLAKAAGEAGVAYAKACLAKNGNIPQWTDAKPLTPSSDCAGTQRLEPAVQVLIVAGGGGGARTGSGGGAGGVIQQDSVSVSVGVYPVVVGAGGAGGGTTTLNVAAGSGGNSSFSGLTAIGGGGGYSHSSTVSGTSGGSGSGAATVSTGSAGAGGAGTASQGYPGGAGTVSSGWLATAGGGGGGAGGAGVAAGTVAISGNGGIGIISTIGGSVEYYAGGGGAGEINGSSVGLGAGGQSQYGAGSGVNDAAGTVARTNSGSGGGGGSYNGTYFDGGAGGSGVVIIKYPANGSITATGGTKTDDGVNVVHRFTSGTVNFQVTAATTSSCPLDDRCTVAIQGNARSSFRVGLPTVDSSGKALAIPNNGYVELLRSSNGSVWRTYSQPSVQAAVVPDLCSGGNTASATGWSNALRATTQSPVPGSSAAETISLSTSPLVAGKVYYRKDFSVPSAGTYNLSYTGIGAQDSIQVYLNGVSQSSGDGSAVRSASLALSPGCYNLTFVVENATLESRESGITASLRFNEGAPLVVSDTSWRVAAGAPVHFSSSDFDENPSMWQLVATADSTLVTVPSWTATEDTWNRMIVPNHSGCWATCPGGSYAYLRDYKDVVVTSNTEVRLSVVCDDFCNVYMDGSLIQPSSPWNSTATQNITLTPGSHRFALRLQNGGSAANGSRAGFSVKRVSDNVILTRTDAKWKAANTWTSTALDPYSYEASFIPSPAPVLATAKVDALVVAGGGGGGADSAGGGGGGGVQFFKDVPIGIGANGVVVGAGGTGSATATNGGNSQFISASYLSNGGGSGSSRSSTAKPAGAGGSGGGGSSGRTSDLEANRTGGLGIFGQGGSGGLAGPRASVSGTGGGGGGSGGDGLGGTTTAGNGGAGGPGYITYITGTRLAVGGGGGGGGAALAAYGAATDGASATGSANASANTGGGGAGGGTARSGGSGIVIIRYKTGTITATGGTVTTWGEYTIHSFTATGTFNVTALNP